MLLTMSDFLNDIVSVMEASIERSDDWKDLEKEIDRKLSVSFKEEINNYLKKHKPSSVWTPKDMLINRKNNNWGIPNRNLLAFADDGKGNAVCYDMNSSSFKYWDGENFNYDDIGSSLSEVIDAGYLDNWAKPELLSKSMDTKDSAPVIEAADDDDDETLTVKDGEDDTLTVKSEESRSSLREDGIDLDEDLDDDEEEGPKYRRKSAKKAAEEDDESAEDDEDNSSEDDDSDSSENEDDDNDDDSSDNEDDDSTEDEDEDSSEDDNDDDDDSTEYSDDDTSDDNSEDDTEEVADDEPDDEPEKDDKETSKDIKYLNKLIASEMAAVNEYLKGALETDNSNLKRLYSDIGMEERFHAEQLSYAKSLITGETYTPRDRKVKAEYIELNGDPENDMDEEETLETAIDKVRLQYSMEALILEGAEYYDEAFYDELDALNEQIEVFEMMQHLAIHQEQIIRESAMTYKPFVLEDEDEVITETVYNTGRNVKSLDSAGKKIKSFSDLNPITIFGSIWLSIYNFGKKIIDAIKHIIDSIGAKISEFADFIDKHGGIGGGGIKALFQPGFKMYFYSEEKAGPDPEVFTYMIFLNQVANAICDYTHITPPKDAIEVDLSKYEDVKNYFGGVRKINWNSTASKMTKVFGIQDVSGWAKKHFTEGDLQRAMNQIDNIKLIKSKIIVTKENEANLAKYLFGYSKEKIGNSSKSLNIYNVFNEIRDEMTTYMKNTKKMFAEFQDESNKPDSFLGKNPTIRQNGLEYFTKTINGFKIFLNALASDMNTMSKISKLMKEQKRSTERLDQIDSEELSDEKN